MAIVIFDLFGTVIDKRKYDYNAALKWLADTYFNGEFKNLIDLSIKVKESYLKKRQISNMETSFCEQLKIFENELHTSISDDYLNVEERFLSIFRDEYLLDGAGDLLNYLYEQNCATYLFSNSIFSGRSLRRYLNTFGIDQYFQKIYSSADIGFRKPSKESFNFVLTDIGVTNSNDTYYVGDSFEKDYLGALGFNITPILIASNKEINGLCFENLNQLLKYFKQTI